MNNRKGQYKRVPKEPTEDYPIDPRAGNPLAALPKPARPPGRDPAFVHVIACACGRCLVRAAHAEALADTSTRAVLAALATG
jgi:hypothetical protein